MEWNTKEFEGTKAIRGILRELKGRKDRQGILTMLLSIV